MSSFIVHDNQAAGRAMHALVIGVGYYPHLLGGTGPRTDSHDGMGQLTSPPVSARHVADWLAKDFHHPDFPRHTVALLLSEDNPQPYVDPLSRSSVPLEEATFQNIKDAVTQWRQSGDQHGDDMLVFYFCGHGISEGHSMVLLPSDFGSDANAYDHAIDFLNLYDGMNQYKASRQCFFVDACRASSDTLDNNRGRNLLQVRPRTEDEVRVAPVYYATLRGEDSYGREERPSVFAEALIRCLNNYGAHDDEGESDWRVSNFRLAEALDHLMLRARKDGSVPAQVPQAESVRLNFYINHLRSPPEANIYVYATPPQALMTARVTCQSTNPPTVITPDSNLANEWAVSVPSGEVEIAADLGGGTPLTKTVEARPIFRNVHLSQP